MSYIGKSPSGTGVRSRFYFTQSSGGGTSISGTDDNSKTLTFTDGEYIDVYLNGVLLVAGTDYNTTTANTIGGLAALASGDVVEVVVYDIFTVADTVSQSSGGTFSGAVGFSGGITGDVAFDTNTLKVDSSNNRVGIGTTAGDAGASLTINKSPVAAHGNPLVQVGGSTFTSGGYYTVGLGFTNSTYTEPPAEIAYVSKSDSGGTKGDIVFGTRDVTTNTAVSTRMSITSDGKLIMGTTSSISDDLLQIQTPASGGGTGIQFKRNDANTDQGLGRLRWGNTADDDVGIISVKTDGATDSGAMLFQTASSGTTSERMRIDSNGHVGINDTNPSEAQLSVVTQQNESAAFIHCNASSMTGATLAVSSSRNTTGGTYSHLECAIHGVAVKMKVLDGGDVKNTNNSYGAISDQRMKENIVDAASQWDDIKALQIRKYNRIGETQKELGVIAQELEASGMGGLVEEGQWYDVDNNSDDETRKSVKYSILYMKAVKALQEAMTRIETLETQNTTQATQIADLITRVTALEDV